VIIDSRVHDRLGNDSALVIGSPAMALHRVETLFLDAGGVLVNPNWQRVAEAFREQGVCVTADALREAEPKAKRSMDTVEYVATSGDATRAKRYFDLVFDLAGVTAGPARQAALGEVREYHARENLWEDVPGDVPGALSRFQAAGLRVVVVSNSNGRLRDLLRRLGLLEFFALVVDSFEEGLEKPDPRLFERALERAGARRESTLHVGDFFEIDVVGARAAGLQAALLDVAGLYPTHDCPRFASLGALADELAG
jgi:putative hydrolase of the HAD superfamily